MQHLLYAMLVCTRATQIRKLTPWFESPCLPEQAPRKVSEVHVKYSFRVCTVM